MRKGVITARYSSNMQRDESIEAQVRACKYYAQQNNIEVVDIYADKAKSGMYKAEKREEFNRMMRDADTGKFEVVLCHKLSRFGRDGVKALNDRAKLEMLGIDLISVTERLEKTPEGQLMLYVITGMNEFFSRNLAQEVLKGQRENAYQCKSTGGKPCLGYDLDEEKHYIINEREAEAVRIIFRMYTEGYSYSEIMGVLNGEGYKTKHGNRFGKNSLHEILRNERYIGFFTYGKTTVKDGHRNNHEVQEDFIKVPDGCPRIVDDETWERAQKIMKERRRSMPSNKAKRVYVLSGKLFCGLCGHKMVGASKSSKGKVYNYYQCCSRNNKKDCTMPLIPKELLEDAVFEKIGKIIFTQDYVDKIAQLTYDSYETKTPDTTAIEAGIKEAEKKIANLVAAIAKGTDVPEIHEAIQTLRQEKNGLQEQLLVKLEAPAERMSVEQLKSYYSNLINIHKLDEAGKRAVVQKYISSIKVFPPPDDGGEPIIEVEINPNDIEHGEFVHTVQVPLSAPDGTNPNHLPIKMIGEGFGFVFYI